MSCVPIQNVEYRNYICFEHTTYLFEFSRRFGPAWFTVPGEEWVIVEPDGHLAVLWDVFEAWQSDIFFSSMPKTKKEIDKIEVPRDILTDLLDDAIDVYNNIYNKYGHHHKGDVLKKQSELIDQVKLLLK